MIGKWVLVDDGEYYHVGEVVSLAEGCALLRLRPTKGPSHQRLFFLDALSNETLSVWFDAEAELDAYLAWLEEPSEDSKLKVVKLRDVGKPEK